MSKMNETLEYLQDNTHKLLAREAVESVWGKETRHYINRLIKRWHLVKKIRGAKNKIIAYQYKGYKKTSICDWRFTKRNILKGNNIEEVILDDVVKPVGSFEKFWNYLFKR